VSPGAVSVAFVNLVTTASLVPRVSPRDFADRRPIAAAGLAFAVGVAALVASVPSITLAATEPSYDDGRGSTSAVDATAGTDRP
jgi:hypothetical protein